jgi:hypothetical protein
MRYLWLLLSVAPLPAGQTLFRATVGGGQSIYQGHDLWLQITPRWYDAETASINLANHTVTVPARTYANGETIFTLSSGQLPSTLDPYYTSYAPCQSTGNTFRIVNTSVGNCNETSMKLFTDAGTGQFYVAKQFNGASTRLRDIVVPPGVTAVAVISNSGTALPFSNGLYTVSGNSATFVRIHLIASPDAPTGTGLFRATLDVTGHDSVLFEWPIHVKPAPKTIISRPTAFPPVPGKAKFESEMLARGNQWCDKSTGVMKGITNGILQFGVEQQVWFYDGGWVYRQIAAYTGDTDWIRCAENISRQYRDVYILPNNGSIPDYRIFTDGLKAACASCDGRNRLAVFLIGSRNLAGNGGQVWTSGMREASYLLESTINAANAHGYTEFDRIPNTGDWAMVRRGMLQSSSRLLGMMDSIRGDHFRSQQTFMIGLAMRALIQYWEFTGDPRVPVEIKEVLDYIWDRLWDRSRMRLIFNVSPRGAKCEVTCNPIAHTELINMTVPAFAWYWSLTGDDTYRERGDEIFSHAFDTSINYSGKIFTENYRWGFDYVLLREGKARFRP